MACGLLPRLFLASTLLGCLARERAPDREPGAPDVARMTAFQMRQDSVIQSCGGVSSTASRVCVCDARLPEVRCLQAEGLIAFRGAPTGLDEQDVLVSSPYAAPPSGHSSELAFWRPM